MQCMKDYIGLFYGCGGQTPLSGMYMTNLPGIEFSNIDGIANADQINWSGLWSDLQTTAIDTFREEIINEFNKRYKLKQITQTVDLGANINTTVLTAPIANTTNGLLIELMDQGGQCIGSNFSSIYIQSIKFYWYGTNGTPTLTLNFQDADLLTTELTLNVSNVTQGWNTVNVDQYFNAKRLYVLASGNFSNYVQQDLSLFNLDNFGTFSWGFGTDYSYLYINYGSCGISSRINGVTYNSSTNTAVKGSNCFGMSAILSTKCTYDSLVCANKKHFASVWQHCLAIELLNYRINSSRLNRWTSIDKKQAIELQRLFTLKYRGGMDDARLEYPGKLKLAVEDIRLNDNDGCLRPNDYLIWRERTP